MAAGAGGQMMVATHRYEAANADELSFEVSAWRLFHVVCVCMMACVMVCV